MQLKSKKRLFLSEEYINFFTITVHFQDQICIKRINIQKSISHRAPCKMLFVLQIA